MLLITQGCVKQTFSRFGPSVIISPPPPPLDRSAMESELDPFHNSV